MAYFKKKKKPPKNPHDNIVFPKLTCMHANMSLQCNAMNMVVYGKTKLYILVY